MSEAARYRGACGCGTRPALVHRDCAPASRMICSTRGRVRPSPTKRKCILLRASHSGCSRQRRAIASASFSA
eukprot:47270-Eustigmatos_ZCMA.PRE.1